MSLETVKLTAKTSHWTHDLNLAFVRGPERPIKLGHVSKINRKEIRMTSVAVL